MRRNLILNGLAALVLMTGCGHDGKLPRQQASPELDAAFAEYLQAIADAGQDIHSIMILQHGKVVEEKWMGEGHPDSTHIMNSVSKTFTATAVGLAIAEGKLNLEDKVVDFFPEKVPENASDTLKSVTVRHLLTMNCGHGTDPTYAARQGDKDWVTAFLEWPIDHEPGTYYCYNTIGTYVLSEIVQKVTGQKVNDYLEPRLWKPLDIDKPYWEESPTGANCGGWGLYLKTEDMAKMGQLLLQEGKWKGSQILPAEWVREASSRLVWSVPSMLTPELCERFGMTEENSDWLQGYGYQMWRCRHNAFRADGANGQYIIVLPDQDAVIAMTANLRDMQGEINLVWDHILPALKNE